MILKEVCIENTTNLVNVIEAGANRVELCDNLAEGGTSVSYGGCETCCEKFVMNKM